MTMAPSPTSLTATDPDGRAIGARARIAITNRHVVTIGSLMLVLPNVLFALHLTLLPSVIMLLGAVGAAATMQRRRPLAPGAMLAKPLAVPRLMACLALSIALLVIGGEGHFMFSNWDWLWRDSVLADLSRAPFPPTYEIFGQTFFLRAPLGMYMLPALVAQTTSLVAGHAALLAQNTALLTLVLYLLTTISGRRAPIVIVLFLSFSGLDVLGQLVMWLKGGHSLASFALPSHIESWIGLQFSSVITQLFWVPNHALPSYWLTLLVFLCARDELELGELGIVLAASLFWSPFAFIGTLPFVVYLFARDARRTIITPRFWVAGAIALCFIPVAFYMRADAAQVPHEFVLFHPFMVYTIVFFLLVEIPHVAIVREVWTDLEARLRGLLIAAIVVLVVLPTMRVGSSGDLVMRASIPALMVLAFFFAQAMCSAWEARRVAVWGAGLALAIVGAVTPAQEITRAFTFSPFAVSSCNIVTVWQKIWAGAPTIENYLARRSTSPEWLISPAPHIHLTNQPGMACWPDIPFSPLLHTSSMSNKMLLHSHDVSKEPPL